MQSIKRHWCSLYDLGIKAQFEILYTIARNANSFSSKTILQIQHVFSWQKGFQITAVTLKSKAKVKYT